MTRSPSTFQMQLHGRAWLLGILLGVIPSGEAVTKEVLTLPTLLGIGQTLVSSVAEAQGSDLSPSWGVNGEQKPSVDVKEAGRSCGACGTHTKPSHSVHKLSSFPHLEGIGGKLSLMGTWTVLGLAIPILVLQIVTLAIVAYLLKNEKKTDDYDGTGGTLYYGEYPSQGSSGYSDSYSKYRSLVRSEEVPGTLGWGLSRALKLDGESRTKGASNAESLNSVSKTFESWNKESQVLGSINDGHKNTASKNSGSWNAGSKIFGPMNAGIKNSDAKNPGSWNAGSKVLGSMNTGPKNNESKNSGSWNNGFRKSLR